MKIFLFLWVTCSLWAQPQVLYMDDFVLPHETEKTKGYVVLTSGDTLRGYLRNQLTLGQLLAPEELTMGNLTVNFRRYSIEKIAFWTGKEADKQLFFPGQLKGFGFESPASQLPIELTAPHAAGGIIKKEKLKEQISLNGQLNRVLEVQADQQRLHDGLIHYEVLPHPTSPQVRLFGQRLAEGVITLYFFHEAGELLFKRRQADGMLVTSPALVRYDPEGRFLRETFGACPEVQRRLVSEPELQKPANFVRRVGITNLYCDAGRPQPEVRPESYVVTLQGDTLRGKVNWLLFMQKIQFADKAGHTRKFAPDQLTAVADVTGYGAVTVYESHALPGKSGKKVFCQVLSSGEIKLLRNPRASSSSFTNVKGETTTKIASYLLQKQGKDPILVNKANFEALFKDYFPGCTFFLNELERDPALRSYHSIEALVKRYNALCPAP